MLGCCRSGCNGLQGTEADIVQVRLNSKPGAFACGASESARTPKCAEILERPRAEREEYEEEVEGHLRGQIPLRIAAVARALDEDVGVQGASQGAGTRAPVVLHIYDVTTSVTVHNVNQVLHLIGTGAFHGAVEIYGEEWSFGFCEVGTGVFSCEPTCCQEHRYRESVAMGETSLSEDEVDDLVIELQAAWQGHEYDVLRRNCVVFSNELCQRLGVGPVPHWVTNLAAAGASIEDGVIRVSDTVRHGLIVAAAKAGDFDERYHITGTARAEARHFVAAMQGLDKKYHIREHVAEAGHQISEGAHHMAEHLREHVVEAGHQISEGAHHVSERAQHMVEELRKKRDVSDTRKGKYPASEYAHQLSDNPLHAAAMATARLADASITAEKKAGDSGSSRRRWWSAFRPCCVHARGSSPGGPMSRPLRPPPGRLPALDGSI